MHFPDPLARFPVSFPDGSRHKTTVFLSQVLSHPNIHVGDYSYYSDTTLTEETDIAAMLAPYLFEGAPEHIRIGRFCQIAQGVQFITQSANHDMSGLTSYPFPIFDPDQIGSYRNTLPTGSDIVIGNDVWIGRDAKLMPNAQIGDGVIIAAYSVVSGKVPPFSIYGGNPARLIRARFDAETVQRMLALAWWNWPADKLERALPLLQRCDLDSLDALS
ncbi:MAG: CatB-related O-acetyltransferase [Pseudomonadota bacterium]